MKRMMHAKKNQQESSDRTKENKVLDFQYNLACHIVRVFLFWAMTPLLCLLMIIVTWSVPVLDFAVPLWSSIINEFYW